jgi:iron-sulfur cluster assembly protein
MIHISELAAKQMIALAAEKNLGPNGGLRLFVSKGGCAGLQYEMEVALPAEGDLVFSEHGALLYVPQESLGYLEGSTIDYVDGLTGAGFRIKNPRAARNCGCGTSFEPANAM